MEQESIWVLEQLEKAFETSQDYKQKALLLAAKDLIEEQVIRIEQMQGEVDGTMWSPRQWK